MSTKQIIYALALAVVLGAIAWALTLVGPRQASVMPITHVLSGTATSTGFEYTENHPYYTVDIVYPNTGNQAEQTAIETALKGELADYAQSVEGLDASMMPSLEQGYKLALDINYQKFSGAGQTTSYLFSVYEDTGGAHPNHYFRTFVFGQGGAELSLGDLFVSTSTDPLGRSPATGEAQADYLGQIAAIATPDVTDQMRQRLGGDPTGAIFEDGLAPTAENYQDFVIDQRTLRFFFPPYQVAAYAAGDFTVDIPLSKFGGILKPEFR